MASGPTATSAPGLAGRYRFGDVEVDAAAHVLRRGGEPQAVEPKAFAVLLVLLRQPGALVPRDELLDAVWGHRHVTPGVLTRAIAQLRTALGDDPHQPRYIRTQHAVGYAFIGELAPAGTSPPTDAEPAPPLPEAPPTPAAPVPSTAPRRHGGDRRRGPPAGSRRLLVPGLALALAVAWWAWPAHTPPPLEASIAVLPFTAPGGSDDDRGFAEGLSMEMLGALSEVDGLTVAAWRGADAIGAVDDPLRVGRELGVATLLDATVRREGERLRIVARLTDARRGLTVWSESYEGDAASVFDTQATIAREVAQALVGVLPDAGAGLQRRLAPTRDVAAFEAYLRGLPGLLQPAQAGEASLAAFRDAVARDPGFARAQAAICRLETWRFEAQHNPDAFENARLACLRAAGMDPTIGPVQLALGDLYRVQGEHRKALEHYVLAAADRTVRADALVGQATVHADAGDGEAAIAAFSDAVRIAPDDASVHASLSYQQYVAGRLPEAIAALKRATELRTDDAWLWSTYGGVLLAAGDDAAAIAAFERSLAIEPIEAVISNLGTLKYQAGDYAAAVELNRRALALNDANAEIWGNLGDALAAAGAPAAEIAATYREAATRTEAYLAISTDDDKSRAQLGWYLANLDDGDGARASVARAEAGGRQAGEVALYAALTYARLDDPAAARVRVDAARAGGIAEARLATHAMLRDAGLVPTAADAATAPTGPPAVQTASPGERDE